jgi:exo-1,4-beta-D-glucosaminidase
MKTNQHFISIRVIILGIIFTGISACSKHESDSVLLLKEGWQLQSSQQVNKSGEELSLENSEYQDWYNADVPSTVFGSLVKQGVYKDIFWGRNLEKVDKKQFQTSWWYRNRFNVNNKDASTFILEFDGIIFRSNIWLNGKQIASADTLAGPFRQFNFNVTRLIKKDAPNILAVEVFPPVAGELTIGFVDWNPEPPDRSMGLWREVRLRSTGDISIKYPYVISKLDTATLNYAELTVSCEATNNSPDEISGKMDVEIGNEIHISKKVNLKPGETSRIVFSPDDFSELKVKNPRIWWTHDLGKPELYNLKINFLHKNMISDRTETHFGIRDIREYKYIKYGRHHNGYLLNGKKILVKGGGWVDQLFLMPDSVNLERQIEYVKHMNLNAIRPEGFWGNNQDLYDLCDREGVLIMTGWSCQWEWPDYCGKKECDDLYGCIQTKDEIQLVAQSWKDMIKWLRNHPSIFMWMTGSDMLPLPELEKKYISILAEDDPSRPMVTSAAMHESTISGWSGMKMEGPYEYTPPVYWYADTVYGGAYGFNTETGPGAQVPPIESIQEMIPSDSLWPINEIWEFHCGRNEFQTLSRYNRAMNERFGKPASLDEYCKKAQLLNYESIRPMFEAFVANRYNATGIIQWMLNSSWPKLIWQLYGFDLLPNAALYGTKKALEPLHALYNYDNREIVISNSSLQDYKNLTVSVKVLNLDMHELLNENIPAEISQDERKAVFTIPENIKGLDSTYFLDIRVLSEKEHLITINQYLLTRSTNEFAWNKTYFVNTPLLKYQHLEEINLLPAVHLESILTSTNNKEKTNMVIELENKSENLAFSIELMIMDDKTNHFVAPVYLDDNYFSLLPGEKRTIEGYCYTADLNGAKPVLKVSGFNIK